MYPNTVAYQKGKNAKYYINAAGGFAQNARKSNAYIIYMNGMVNKVSQGAKIKLEMVKNFQVLKLILI